METVGNFPDLAAARLAESLLAAEGIVSFIPDEYVAGVDWQMSTALHGIRLQVAPEDADEARNLLSSISDAGASSETAAIQRSEFCAKCGSESVMQARWKHRLKAVTLLLPVLLLAWPFVAAIEPALVCSSCGHRWKPNAG